MPAGAIVTSCMMLTPPSSVRYGPLSFPVPAALARNAGVAIAAATITVNAIFDNFIIFLLLLVLACFGRARHPLPKTLQSVGFINSDARSRKCYFYYS